VNNLRFFERIVRNTSRLTALPAAEIKELSAALEQPHPFEVRNIHPDLPKKVKVLFDDGHYAEATFESCKYLDHFIGKHAPATKAGEARMMAAFSESSPIIKLTAMSNDSEKDEQRGYKFLFAGTMVAIRNPRGHEHSVIDDPGLCLDHLGLVSALLRRLNKAGLK